MDFKVYEKGKPTGLQGPDGVTFDISDSGATLLIRMSRPTAKEKKAFEQGISIRFAIVNDIIFALVRMGLSQWMDAPYCKALSRNLSRLYVPQEGQGLAVHALLVDGMDGILINQKIIGLSTELTRNLFNAIANQPMIPDYNSRLQNTFSQYSTNDLLKISFS